MDGRPGKPSDRPVCRQTFMSDLGTLRLCDPYAYVYKSAHLMDHLKANSNENPNLNVTMLGSRLVGLRIIDQLQCFRASVKVI